MSSKCDAHQINTTGKRASGTSSHKVNLNPELGRSLTLLHTTLNRVTNSATRMNIYNNVQSDHKRKDSPKLDTAVKTRWNSEHKEAVIASANQRDLSVALDRMISQKGIDAELFKSNIDSIGKVKPTPFDWELYMQYACGIAPLKQYSEFSQSKQVIFHKELWEGRMAIEKLSAKYFEMYENLSEMVGGRATNLKCRKKNNLVVMKGFHCKEEFTTNYKVVKEMHEPIALARRLAVRNLARRLQFYKTDPGERRNADQLDCDLSEGLFTGLVHCDSLNEIKIMGAIVHPLFQNVKRMVACDLCTRKQYSAGEAELLKRMIQMIDFSKPGTNNYATSKSKGGNEWDDSDDDETDIYASKASGTARDELQAFLNWKKGDYLPVMSNKKSLGAWETNGVPRNSPILSLGKVQERGNNLPSGQNHADYIDDNGNYDIVSFFIDHKTTFPFLSKVIIGQLAPHITTEVDCESLFSQAGHLSHPNRNRTVAKTFERLVTAKHRLSRIYCDKEKVKQEFIDRWKKKKFSPKEDRDDLEFWEQQKEEYLQENPNHWGMFNDTDDCDE